MVEDYSRKSGSSGTPARRIKSEGGGSSSKDKGSGSKVKSHSHNSSGGKQSSSGVKREPSVKREKEDDVLPKEKRKPGQKYATPSPGQADRVFYETLLKQKPDSHMAQDWCLAYGVCPAVEAEALYKKVCQWKGVQPSAAAPALSGPSPTKKPKRPSSGSSRPRSTLPKEMDADTGFAPSSAFEGVGTTGF